MDIQPSTARNTKPGLVFTRLLAAEATATREQQGAIYSIGTCVKDRLYKKAWPSMNKLCDCVLLSALRWRLARCRRPQQDAIEDSHIGLFIELESPRAHRASRRHAGAPWELSAAPPAPTPRCSDSQKGGHLDPSQVARIVRQAARLASVGLNVSPHWMRHAHASRGIIKKV